MDGKYYKCYISWMVNTTSVIYHGWQILQVLYIIDGKYYKCYISWMVNPKSVIYHGW